MTYRHALARTAASAAAVLASVVALASVAVPADAAASSTVTTAAMSEATSKSTADPAGDVKWYRGYRPTKDAKGMDLLRMTAERATTGAGRNTLKVTLKLADLNSTTNGILYWRAVHIATSAGTSFGMNDDGEMYNYTGSRTGVRIACGLKVARNIAKDTVTFQVPVSCFGGAYLGTLTAASGKNHLDDDVIGHDQARSLKGVDLRVR